MLHDIVDHRFMCRFGVDFDEGEKLAGELRVKTKDPRGTSINDFSIPDIIRTLKSLVYEACCFCYALSNSAKNVPIEAIVKKLSMVTQSV